jgi:hypothetical protein
MAEGQKIYRNASGTDDSLTPRAGVDTTGPYRGLSFWDDLDKLNPGKWIEVDTSKLDHLQAMFDDAPPGHVSVRPASQREREEWAASRGTGVRHPLTQELLDARTGEGRKA